MPSWQRVYLSLCAGLVAYSLTYMGVDYARVPRWYHYPVLHEWHWEVRAKDPVAAGYVGLWLWALAVALVVTALVYGLTWGPTRLCRRPASHATLGLCAAWALTFLVLAGAYYTWNNFP